jgi:hypothetical protein
MLIVSVSSFACAEATARPPSERDAVASVIKRQVVYFNEGRWARLWALFSPRFRRLCRYEPWRRLAMAARELTGRTSVTITSVSVNGNRAYATYTERTRASRPQVTRRDVYVKIGDRWFDELDAKTGPCFRRESNDVPA